tara:strand:+ start:816 stop:1394 length:579 start_codon:yes stop_codon:yes gene_type:complete
MDINQTTLIGTVVDPPKINSFDGRDGKPRRVGNITVLTEIARGEYTTKTFHRVTAWGGLVDTVASLSEGSRVYVQGMYKSRSYEKDGIKRTAMEIDASQIALAPMGVKSEEIASSPRPPVPSGPPVSSPWPYTDSTGTEWPKPDAGCSYSGSLACAWADESDPSQGGKIYKEENGQWVDAHVKSPPDDDIPF